jgi:outer membrane protein TolC
LCLCAGFTASAQNKQDSLLQAATLEQCINYALTHQAAIQQALVDEKITEYNIKSRLADWYPQLNTTYNLQHNFQRPTFVVNGNPVIQGFPNQSSVGLGLSQVLFNRDVFLASRTRRDAELQARQNTVATKIDITVEVTKAFYDILATQQQIKVAEENIVRLEKSLSDAYYQYKAGVVDKTDYKRATISLNNTKASLKANRDVLTAKKEYLKYLMGYPVKESLAIVYDSLAMERQASLDTALPLDFSRRIEYQSLQTQRNLQVANLRYQKLAFIPTISLNGQYNFNYFNDNFSKVYANNFPNSYVALTAAFPIFQGGKRRFNIKAAEWQVTRVDWDIVNTKNSINSEYATALANYKANLANYQASKENVALAQEVYDVLDLQYRNGIKTYLEVITAQTDLRTAQINYFNALYQLLSSKTDVQRALGQITY